MAEVLTVTELKQRLKALPTHELVHVICQLYKSNDKNKQIMTALFIGDEYVQKLLTEYKQKMRSMFFRASRFMPLSSIKKLIASYKKIPNNQLLITDLMLFFVECGTDFINAYGDIDAPFYSSLCSVFGAVVENISKAPNDEIYHPPNPRLNPVCQLQGH